MKIVRIKKKWLGGWILSLYDLGAKEYVGSEHFILPGRDDIVAKQFAATFSDFSKDVLVVGIMDDLKALSVEYGVTPNPKWRIHHVPPK